MWSLGVKLDGRDPKEFGLIFLQDHYHPMTPGIRNKTLAIPGMSGEWDFGSERGPKPFNLPFGIIEYDRYEKQRKLRNFVSFLFDVYGQPRPMKLIFDYEPDKFNMVKLASKIDPQRLIHAAEFDLPLIAHYPDAEFIVPTDEIGWDSDIPFTSDISLDGEYVFDITGPKTLNIINDGTLVVKPTILITGTANSLSLTINGESFSFGSISTPIEIQKYLVKVNGVSSLSAMTGKIENLNLLPGDNVVQIDGINLNLNIRFKFNYQYI